MFAECGRVHCVHLQSDFVTVNKETDGALSFHRNIYIYIYVCVCVLIPMILVRSHIIYMLGGEIGKNTWDKQSEIVRVWTARLLVLSLWLCLLCNIPVHCEGVDCKVTGIEFIVQYTGTL